MRLVILKFRLRIAHWQADRLFRKALLLMQESDRQEVIKRKLDIEIARAEEVQALSGLV